LLMRPRPPMPLPKAQLPRPMRRRLAIRPPERAHEVRGRYRAASHACAYPCDTRGTLAMLAAMGRPSGGCSEARLRTLSAGWVRAACVAAALGMASNPVACCLTARADVQSRGTVMRCRSVRRPCTARPSGTCAPHGRLS
jgi:hypothetical protein